MKHQLPVFLRAAFIGLFKFVLGCVLWIALSIALHECLSWAATQHYPQDGAVSPLFLVPVHTQAGLPSATQTKFGPAKNRKTRHRKPALIS